jgi:hypothetical protein
VKGVSVPEQTPSPHTTVGTQSFGQLDVVSGGTHWPSPQPPQSTGHVVGVSVRPQTPSPQITMQSDRHVCASPGAQMPSPHTVFEQSAAQLVASSFVPQMLSPQNPQSTEQVVPFS